MHTVISRYISSTGGVYDYIVRQGTYEDYINLCKESQQLLYVLLDAAGPTDGDRVQAISELAESYRKTIEGEQPEKAKYDEESGYRYLKCCIAEYKKVIVEPPSKQYRNRVTMFKDMYRKILPISNYIGTLKISSNKCEACKDITDSEFKDYISGPKK